MLTKTKIENNALTGLCTNCIYHDECSYLVTAKHPVLFCNEYENIEVVNYFSIVKENFQKTNTTAALHESSESKGQGLCINCAYNGACSYAKAGKEVYLCEEYR